MLQTIVELVRQEDDWNAETISKYAKALSFAESFIRLYYIALDDMEAAMKGRKSLLPLSRLEVETAYSVEEFQALEKKLKERAHCISGIFLDAVNRHDGEMIMNLANAVWFFKDKRGPNFIPADPERSQLLFLKLLLKKTGERLTVRQVAQFLALRNLAFGEKLDIKAPADGFSALRRKCKQLGIPLAASRKISRK